MWADATVGNDDFDHPSMCRLGECRSRPFSDRTHFEEYTGHVEKSSLPTGGTVETERETRLEEQHDFAEGDFYKFKPREAVVCRQGEGYVYGRIQMLKQ